MEKAYKAIDFWSEKNNGLFQLEPEPFQDAPMTPRSKFLFSYSLLLQRFTDGSV